MHCANRNRRQKLYKNKQASTQHTRKKPEKKRALTEMAHDTVADQASPMPDPPPFVHIKCE